MPSDIEHTVPETANHELTDQDIGEMLDHASEASALLKTLGHEGRLMLLCHLVSGEKSVTELEELISSRQASVSQQLARLRMEGLVKTRRDGKSVYYSLTDTRPAQILDVVYEMFCSVRK